LTFPLAAGLDDSLCDAVFLPLLSHLLQPDQVAMDRFIKFDGEGVAVVR
jgi:hypothetical protein